VQKHAVADALRAIIAASDPKKMAKGRLGFIQYKADFRRPFERERDESRFDHQEDRKIN
jgi:hypothetical protein